MQIELAQRTQHIHPSATLAVAAHAARLKAQGQDIISLSSGEPDFDTPRFIKQAAITAINNGFTKYTPVDGIPELKQAIIDKLQNDNQLSYQPAHILVSVGAKQSLFNLTQALLNPDDEVLIPAPYWVSYPDMVKLAEATPVIIPAGKNYKITAEQLHNAITPKTKLLLFNSPNNPTGAVYTATELQALAEVLRQYPSILIATDDIYEHILWAAEPFANLVQVCPDLYERTVVINGVSKAYAMTGWRIGYAAGPEALIKTMKKIQSQSTSNPTSIAQHAALAALTGDQTPVIQMKDAFYERYQFIYQQLSDIPGVKVSPSHGAFYSLPNMEQIIRNKSGIDDDVALAKALLSEQGVAVVPGSAFGAPGCIRISFATDMDTLAKAMERIKAFAVSVSHDN